MRSPVRSSRPRNHRSRQPCVCDLPNTLANTSGRSEYARQIIAALIYGHETSSAPPTST